MPAEVTTVAAAVVVVVEQLLSGPLAPELPGPELALEPQQPA